MFYPALTRFSCAECQAFVYDVDWTNGCEGTGNRKKFCGGTRDVVRPAASPPPCELCPKGSPAEEHEHLLTADNWLTLELFREVKATNGACLTDEMKADRLLMQNLAAIDQLWIAKERQRLGREIAANVVRFSHGS